MASSRLINNAFIANASCNDWLLDLVNTRLAEIMTELPPSEDSEFGCLLADIGDYLVKSIAVLSRLADGLANGTHISMYAKEGIKCMVEESEFSDLDFVSYMDSKHQSLRQLASHIQLAAQTAQRDWQQSRKPLKIPKELGKRPVPSDSSYQVVQPVHVGIEIIESSNNQPTGRANYAGTPHNTIHVPESSPFDDIDSSDSDNVGYDAVEECLRSLSSTVRGKGNFFCPLGARCTKGGVSPNGAVIKFERNSAFKTHLQKHKKPYNCDLAGCKNKKGFARYDQLRRHKETVLHSI